MATAAEVLAIEQLHQAAQARLGIAAAYLALAEWEGVNALNAEETATVWIVTSLRIITAVRKMSRKLAIAYYQLSRALESGTILGAPIDSPATGVTVGQLRTTFRDIALDVASLPAPLTPSADPDIRWFEEELQKKEIPDSQTPGRLIRLQDAQVDPLIQNLLDVEGSDSSSPVSIDKWDWEPELSFDEVDELFRDLLWKQAVKRAADKARALRASQELSPDRAMTLIEQSHDAAGSLGSGTVDELGMEGGRQAIDKAIRKDKRIKLVARGTSSDPCAFCSMLASRGFVFTGETSGVGDAEDGSVGDEITLYHPNCHCFPIVRFVNTSDTLPPMNAYFQEMWPTVTDGYSGNDARKAWRRWIYAQRKANPDTPHSPRRT
ncbi:MAG TPA: hypothetical protein VJ617_10020 [Arthrobacter sp.]|nr:hypothetical protein [Arthrobacter sp.]